MPFPAQSRSGAARPCAARRGAGLAAALIASIALVGCASVRVPAGADAGDPACAPIVVSSPDALLGQPRQETSSQGTVAWGTGEDAIVLRCGVPSPPPTTEDCTRVGDPDGVTVDWIVREQGGIVTYTTYGRTPAIDVSVPRSVGGDQPSAAVLDLAQLVEQIPATETCTGPEDL